MVSGQPRWHLLFHHHSAVCFFLLKEANLVFLPHRLDGLLRIFKDILFIIALLSLTSLLLVSLLLLSPLWRLALSLREIQGHNNVAARETSWVGKSKRKKRKIKEEKRKKIRKRMIWTVVSFNSDLPLSKKKVGRMEGRIVTDHWTAAMPCLRHFPFQTQSAQTEARPFTQNTHTSGNHTNRGIQSISHREKGKRKRKKKKKKKKKEKRKIRPASFPKL